MSKVKTKATFEALKELLKFPDHVSIKSVDEGGQYTETIEIVLESEKFPEDVDEVQAMYRKEDNQFMFEKFEYK